MDVQRFSGSMMIRIIVLSILIATPARASWPNTSYAEVRAYVYNPNNVLIEEMKKTHTVNFSIVQNGKLAPTVVNKAGAVLNPDQVRRLLRAINGKHPDHIRARCFNPHHAFVFYDSAKRPVASVIVCFECSNIEKDPADPTQRSEDMDALLELCKELQLPLKP